MQKTIAIMINFWKLISQENSGSFECSPKLAKKPVLLYIISKIPADGYCSIANWGNMN